MRRAGLLLAAALLALGAAGAARAELVKHGDLLVNFDGGISPRALPREGTAPVAVSVDSTFRSAEGADPPPQLRTIAIGINQAGQIYDRGLPTCRVRKIQPATIRAAKRICHSAIVGHGRVEVRIHLANQPPFTFTGPLLVFHAKPSGGNRRLLAQVYGRKPPSAFVLNFKIVQKKGTFGTVIKTSLPKAARKWAYVTHFDMRLRRIYTYRGQKHSFISAGCAAPAGFPGAVFPFAHANFGFAGGNHVTTTLVRDCTVR
ncbi:MAG TPA: hypothetical protein VFG58_05815 [Solirubrobacterales bacterium]|nr:hypothetical protein [Solirubrobacterales bacterium]